MIIFLYDINMADKNWNWCWSADTDREIGYLPQTSEIWKKSVWEDPDIKDRVSAIQRNGRSISDMFL